MELMWNDLDVSRVTGSTVSQALVEGSIPMPEGRSASEVLDSNGFVEVTETEVLEGKVTLSGRVGVSLVLMGSNGVFAFSSSAIFRHSVNVEGAKAGMAANANAQLQSLDVNLNNNALSMNAMVDIACRVESGTQLRVLRGIRGVEDLELKEMPLTVGKKREVADENVRLREEISAPNVENVLSANATAQVKDVRPNGSNAEVEGTLNVSALCADKEGNLSQITQNFPFTQSVDTDANSKDLSGTANVAAVNVRTVGEDFGLLAVDAMLGVQLFEKQEMSVTLPLDAYSPDLPFNCTHEHARILNYAGNASGRHILRETVNVPEGMVVADRVIYGAGRPVVTASAVSGGRLNVEGLVFCRVIYKSESGSLYAFTEDLPFVAELPVSASDDAEAIVNADCICTHASGTGRNVDLSFAIDLNAEVFELSDANVVTGITEAELPNIPHGIIVYFAGAGETLFDVAKRFNISRAKLLSLNHVYSETLDEGQRLMILL